MSISSTCIDFTNNVSTSNLPTVQGFYNGMGGYTWIENVVIRADFVSLTNGLTLLGIPFIVAIVVFFTITLTLIICCIFQKQCPPCQAWKRDYTKRPYQKYQLWSVTIAALIFMIVSAGICIYGLTAVDGLNNNLKGTKCAIETVIDSSINGKRVTDSNTSWMGFAELSYSLGNITAALDTANSRVTQSLGANNDFLLTSIQNIKQMNNDLNGRYNLSTLTSPNSDINTRVNPITSQFIFNKLGPITLTGTMTYGINSFLENTQKLTEVGYLLDSSARQLQLSTPFIQNNVNNSINLLNMLNGQLDVFQASITAFSSVWLQQYFVYALYALQAVLGVSLAACFLGVTGVLAAHCFNIHNCRLMVHISWILLMILFYFVIIFTYISLPGGGALNGFCTFYLSTLQNQTQFDKYKTYASQNVINKAKGCLFNNGVTLPDFYIQQQINSINTVFDNMTEYQIKTSVSQSSYINLTLVDQQIGLWSTVLNNRRSGLWSDAVQNDTSFNNPIEAIARFSILTNNDTNTMPHDGCPGNMDQWRWDLTNCSTSNQVTDGDYTSKFATGNLVCLTLGNNDQRPSLATVMNRYNSINALSSNASVTTDCQSVFQQISKEASSLIQYRQSRISLFTSINSDLADMLTQYNTLTNNINTFTTQVSTFRTNVVVLDSLLNDALTGINSNTNCSVIATQLNQIHTQLCAGFLGDLFVLAIVFIALVFTVFGAVISGHIFAIRYGKVQLQNKILPEADDISSFDQPKSDLSAFD